MTGPDLPAEGGCRCGVLRFRVTKAPLTTAACHCRGCQRMSGAPYSTTAILPTDGFDLVAGDPAIGGAKSAGITHFHCPDCMSWVFTRIAGLEDQIVNVRATLFDDPGWFAPFIETWTNARLSWATTGARHSFPEFPDTATFMALIAEYGAISAEETKNG